MFSVSVDPTPSSVATAADHLYLITAWADPRTSIFSDFLAGRLLVDCLRQQQHRADTWAFIIMPDYLNWIVQLRRGMSLHKLVEKVLAESTRQLCLYLGQTQTVWRECYRRQAIASEEQALNLARDMVRSPARAGLVTALGDYPLWDARRWLP